MDTFAHGLWGGLAFLPEGRRTYLTAVAVGMAPDLFSFGLFHVTHPEWLLGRLAGDISGPPALSSLPPYVFHAYNFTHSLAVWSLLFIALWFLVKVPPWLLAPWGLHIFCDIPSHAASYFPTPFLWPLPTPFVDGISWASSGFLIANYVALLGAYAVMAFYVRKRRMR
ncbi:MAG TPA: hypothetical protein VE131_00695 [Terriglobales bacterium]|nr:hypothetical protein [Terriglobales bacterium]